MTGKDNWVDFTRRTNDPKLEWLENTLRAAGIDSRRNGESFHAPILQVRQPDYEQAWRILDPVDDVPDHHFANMELTKHHNRTACEEYTSRTITREGFDFRLSFSPQFGFALQARDSMNQDDWIDVSLLQDESEASDVITELLGISLDTE